MATQEFDIDAIIRGRRSRRRWLLVAAVLSIVVTGITTYALLSGEPSDIVVEPQPAQATSGRLTTIIELSGAASTARLADLTFGAGGEVVAVEVAAGDRVEAGQTLARLDDAAAQRRVETAEINLRQAEIRLAELFAGPDLVDIVAAQQSTAAAASQLLSAELTLEQLTSPPTEAETLSSRQAADSAQAQLLGAQTALLRLEELGSGASIDEILAADAVVEQAEASLEDAVSRATPTLGLLVATQARYCNLEHPFDVCDSADIPLSDDHLATLSAWDPAWDPDGDISAAIASLLDANAGYLNALAVRDAAEASLSSANVAREALGDVPSVDELNQARASVSSAEAALGAALERDRELMAGASQQETEQAEASVASADGALASAQAREAALFSSADASEVGQAQLSVRLAEIAVDDARAQLDDMVIRAPFEGVIEAVGMDAGDRVTTNTVAFQLFDEGQVEVDLTVTESDLLELAIGQTGTAAFDAIPDQQYAVRITSVSRAPAVEQGVVTYPVRAQILEDAALAEVAGELSALAGTEGGGELGPSRGPGGAAGAGGAALAGLLEGIDLPEGVSPREVLRSLISGAPLPQGVTLPEGFALPEDFGRAGGGGAGGTGAPTARGTVAGPLPAPGMSASVTVLVEVRPEAVLVPTSAVRQDGDVYFVTVPAGDEGETARVPVTIGTTDGVSVEILGGLEPGDTVLIGAGTEGVPLSVTRGQQESSPQQQFPGFPGGGGRFPGGGAGGGRGGGAQ